MSLLGFSNFALGAVLGMRFGVLILLPLMPLVIVELLALSRETAGTPWMSLIGHAAILIAALDLGYLIGIGSRRWTRRAMQGDSATASEVVFHY